MGKKGILIVGHGSTSGSNESVVEMHAEYLRERGYGNVRHSFKGYSKPYAQNVIAEMAEEGIDDVTVVPLFISRGHYANDVVPKRVGLQKGEKEGIAEFGGKAVRIRITDVFGHHPQLADVLSKAAGEYRADGMNGVLLVGNGSKGDGNRNMVAYNAERLRERIEDNVYTAFNMFDDPTVEQALRSMDGDGIGHITVIPMFVSSGEHTDKYLSGKLSLNCAGDTSLSYSEPIGARPEIGSILESMVMGYL